MGPVPRRACARTARFFSNSRPSWARATGGHLQDAITVIDQQTQDHTLNEFYGEPMFYGEPIMSHRTQLLRGILRDRN